MTEMLVQQQQYTCLRWLCHFGVFFSIPLPPLDVSYKDLAHETQVPETTLRSAIRMVMTMGVLREITNGRVSHNTLSAPFVENPHLKVSMLHMVNQTIPLMGGMIRATEKYGGSHEMNETAYNVAMNTDKPFFEHLKAHPELESEFDSYMQSQALVYPSTSVENLLRGFDWDSLPGGAVVVDVGGGSGSASITVAKEHPHLRFVVQDQEVPINNAKSKMAELPKELAQRIDLREHDFFKEQPVKGADIYLLRTIIHDWPDAEAVKILRRLVQAMKPTSRILIMDMVLPAPNSGSSIFEAALRQKDLAMFLTFNAKERETSDWYDLIQQADARLWIRAIRRPEGCQHSVIEVVIDDGRKSNGVDSVTLNGEDGH